MSRPSDLKADVLRWANNVRQEHGLDPLEALPKGVPCEYRECVLARALWGGVSDCTYDLPNPDPHGFDREFPLPDYVREFVNLFDSGEYPELEETL